MTTVGEIMSSGVTCVDADASLSDAAYLMSSLGIGALPICDTGGSVRGILTDRDIVRYVGAGTDPFSARAGQCADRPPLSVREDEPAAAAARVMAENGVRRLVVLSGSAEVVGMIGEAALARHLSADEFAATMRSILAGPQSAQRGLRAGETGSPGQPFFAYFWDRIGALGRRSTTSTSTPAGTDR